MRSRILSLVGITLQFVFLFCFLYVETNAADAKSDLTDFLLGRILTIGDRLDKIEEKLGAQKSVSADDIPAIRQDIIDAVVKDASLKSHQVSKAFGVEKTNIRAKSEAISNLTETNRDDIAKLKDDSNQTFIKMNNLDERLVRLQDDMQSNKRELLEKFQLELSGLKDDVENGIRQTESISDKIDDNANAVSDVNNHLNDLANQISGGNEKLGEIGRQTENNSRRITDIQQEVNEIKLDAKEMKTALACSNGWSRQLDSCILYVTDKTHSWSDAQNYCKSRQGRLAEPYTDESFDLLIRNAPDSPDKWYLGARDHKKEGSWVWESSSKPMELEHWYDGEPNNDGNEDCLEMLGNKLNDVPCSFKRYFVCEKDIFFH